MKGTCLAWIKHTFLGLLAKIKGIAYNSSLLLRLSCVAWVLHYSSGLVKANVTINCEGRAAISDARSGGSLGLVGSQSIYTSASSLEAMQPLHVLSPVASLNTARDKRLLMKGRHMLRIIAQARYTPPNFSLKAWYTPTNLSLKVRSKSMANNSNDAVLCMFWGCEIGSDANEMACRDKFHSGCIHGRNFVLQGSCSVCRSQLSLDDSKVDKNVIRICEGIAGVSDAQSGGRLGLPGSQSGSSAQQTEFILFCQYFWH
ncbi:hypothetical protein V6N11_053905 [Hibiscus sabdariffa]|uniref:Uncharacterized protein n=1 Tax=Hibiscus sabdariffa TaxID=183260 RepID=A0ABR2S294_9ROSI